MTLLEWFTNTENCAASPSILVLDGGVSTHLERILAKRNQVFEPRELWSSSLLLTNKGWEDIEFSHNAFSKAGADILSSVTYQCHYGVGRNKSSIVPDETMDSMIMKGIQLARANTNQYVAASLGCYGAALADGSEYRGSYGVSMQTLEDFHHSKLKAIMRMSHQQIIMPDVLAFETVPDLQEIKAIINVIMEKKNLPKCASWISMACQNKSHLNDGTPLSEALDLLSEMDPKANFVHAIGVNCCDGNHVVRLVQIIVQHMAEVGPRRGIVFYPNSGEVWDAQAADWKPATGCPSPEIFAETINDCISAIQDTWKKHCPHLSPPKLVVGGCCRTSPDTIAAIRECVDRREAK